MLIIELKEGYLYHIKDEFFDIVNDETLMQNHERGMKRPTYFVIKDEDILWFIPLSSKVDKYKKVIDNKIKKYGYCNTILIRKIFNKEHAILLQNAFPTIEKYIDHVHLVNGNPSKVVNSLKYEITKKFNYLLKLKNQGKDLFFIDIDKIKQIMLENLTKQ